MESTSIQIIIPIVINGFALAVTWGKMSQRIKSLEAQMNKAEEFHQIDTESINKIKVDSERLSVALWGIDGTNGLRGNIRELTTKVEHIREEISEIREALRDAAGRDERITIALEHIQKKLDQ